jgi:hypothetical protein
MSSLFYKSRLSLISQIAYQLSVQVPLLPPAAPGPEVNGKKEEKEFAWIETEEK